MIFLILLTPALLFGKDVDRKKLDYNFDKKVYSTKSGKAFSGVFVMKDSQGNVVKRVTIKDGKQNGVDITYNKDKVSSKFNFKNGIQDGKQYTYSLTTGKLYKIQDYKNGKIDGLSQMYDHNEKLKSEYTYKAGSRDGTYKMFYPNGKIKMLGTYKGFKKSGEWKWFDKNGKVTKTKKY